MFNIIYHIISYHIISYHIISYHIISYIISYHNDQSNEHDDATATLKNIRFKNSNGLIIAYLNINSIRNKIDFLRPVVSEYVDVLIIAQKKIDNTFTTSQFIIEGFMKPFMHDQNRYGGGLLVYVRERAPIKELSSYKPPNHMECGVSELSVKKQNGFSFPFIVHHHNLNNISFVRLVKYLINFVRGMRISF